MTIHDEALRGLRTPFGAPVEFARPTPVFNPPGGDDRIDLKGLFGILRRRAGVIVAVTIAALLAGFAVLGSLPPLYTASNQILIDPRAQRVLDNEVVASGIGSDTVLAESQVRLLSSDAVLRRVVSRLGLAAEPEFAPPPGGGGLGSLVRALLPGVLPPRVDVPAETRALRTLQRRVAVRRAERTYVLEVRASSGDPVLAARIANAIAEAYIADQREATLDAVRRASDALNSRLGELKAQLRIADDRVEAFKARANIVGVDGRLVNEQQLSDLSNQLIVARARVAEARARVEQINDVLRQGGENGAISEAINSGVVSNLRAQLAETSRQEADLSNRLGPRHPSVAAVRAQVRELRAAITEELQRIAQAARNDMQVALANERSLSQSLETLKRQALSTQEQLVPLRELERERDAARAVYEAFLVRAKEASEQQRFDLSNARVIAPAIVPTEAGFPPRPLILVLALFGGLTLGIGIALTQEHFARGYTSPGRLSRATGLDVIGLLPEEGSLRGKPFGRSRGGQRETTYLRAVRHLREALRSSARGPECILVVSAEEGEGKTTLVMNLAIAAASQGEAVLVIDADFGQGAISRQLAPQARHGLAEVLSGEVQLAEAVVHDEATGAYVLPVARPAGGVARRPGRGLMAHLPEITRDFDLVLIDGAPVLHDPSMPSIAEAADSVLLVVRAGRTERNAVTEAVRRLRLPIGKTAATVLNGVPRRTLSRYQSA